MAAQTYRFEIGGLEVEVKGLDLHKSLAESLAKDAVEALQFSENPVLCPGGFRIEFGLGGEKVVCYNAFKVVKMERRIVVEEIGYYRDDIM